MNKRKAIVRCTVSVGDEVLVDWRGRFGSKALGHAIGKATRPKVTPAAVKPSKRRRGR